MRLSYIDYKNSRVLKEGDVIARIPIEEGEAWKGPPEHWYHVMQSVLCGGFADCFGKSGVSGCGVEIGYRSDDPPPQRCELCGGVDLGQSYGVYATMGFGEEPAADDHDYRLHAPVFGTRRHMVQRLVDRRGEIVRMDGENAPHATLITEVLASLLKSWGK